MITPRFDDDDNDDSIDSAGITIYLHIKVRRKTGWKGGVKTNYSLFNLLIFFGERERCTHNEHIHVRLRILIIIPHCTSCTRIILTS